MSAFFLVMAQVNPLVGDIPGNTAMIESVYRRVASQQCDIVVFPELVLTGYPPEDLLLRPNLSLRIEKSLRDLCLATQQHSTAMVIGYPIMRDGLLYNCAGVIANGTLLAEYRKQYLPNYQVFDEKRYFAAGSKPCLFKLKSLHIALSICEDIWYPQPMQQAKTAGAELMININASPFHINKQQEREILIAARAREGNMPVVYVNPVGGQDELVFDGCSMVVDARGQLLARAPAFEESMLTVAIPTSNVASDNSPVESMLSGAISSESITPLLSSTAMIYQALVTGVRDYVNKNRFKGVLLGLSGGIDSALTLAIAVDALGAERVEAVMMPFRYTADMSIEDAKKEARQLGVKFSNISIEPIYDAIVESLRTEFADAKKDKTEENIQARCRGVLLMAISNKKGYMVLTTGNKSEVAVGYCTLYGDMVGGFAVIKDVSKTRVYELATYRNTLSTVIPQRVIDRPPSAELAPGQKDQDSLPPYSVLDQIIELYVEQDCSAQDIIKQGFDTEIVNRVIRLIDLNEYKRRQAAVGVRITKRGFGRDRRYPITAGWKAED